MTTQYTTGQSPRRDRLSVHVTLAFRPENHEDHIVLPVGADGKNLLAYRYNTYAKRPIRETPYIGQADATLHLFKSDFDEHLYYIAEYVQYSNKWICSCGGWLCDHIRTLRGLPLAPRQEVRS